MQQSDAKRHRAAFVQQCRAALERRLGRHFEELVAVKAGGRLYRFDLATPDRSIVVLCKAFQGGFAESAGITTLREAATTLDAVDGNPMRLLILRRHSQPFRAETLGQSFVRLSWHRLAGVVVLELPEDGGELVCLHGSFPTD